MNIFILFSVGILFHFPAFSAVGPKEVVEKIFSKAASPKIVSDKSLQKDLESNVNFSAMAAGVLGMHYGKVSHEEFEWFQNTLREIITRTVYPEAPQFFKNVKIHFKVAEESP